MTNDTPFTGWGPPLLALAVATATMGVNQTAAAAGQAQARAHATCMEKARDASVLRAPAAEYPAFAQIAGHSGAAIIKVALSPNGQVERADVTSSTGDPTLDREAMRVARETQYSAATNDCRTAPSTFLFEVDFEA